MLNCPGVFQPPDVEIQLTGFMVLPCHLAPPPKCQATKSVSSRDDVSEGTVEIVPRTTCHNDIEVSWPVRVRTRDNVSKKSAYEIGPPSLPNGASQHLDGGVPHAIS